MFSLYIMLWLREGRGSGGGGGVMGTHHMDISVVKKVRVLMVVKDSVLKIVDFSVRTKLFI